MTRTFLIALFCLTLYVSNGQIVNDKLIKSKGDSVLKVWVGKGIHRINVKFKEAYHSDNDIRATYTVSFPDNKYSDDLIIYFDKAFKVVDSNFFRTFPDYVLEDRPNDLISKDSALYIAKQSGLCIDDILDFSFYRLYNSKLFVWVIRTDNKKERATAKLKAKGKAVIRTSKACRTRTIDAKSTEVIHDE
jgi:hypothetical protein